MELGPILRSMARNKARFGLIVAEIALTLAIATNCFQAILEVRRKMTIRSGFDDENLVSLRVHPFDPALREEGAFENRLRADLDVIRAVPGVRAVSNSRFLPWQGGGSSGEVRPVGSTGEVFRTQMYPADETTLEALGAHLAAGRFFTREDVERDTQRLEELFAGERPRRADGRVTQPFVQEVVISRAFARRVYGTEDVLGKLMEDRDGDQYLVIGLVDRFYNPYGWPIHEFVTFYATFNGSADSGGAPYLVRTEPGRAAAVARDVEEALIAAHPGRVVEIRPIPVVKAKYFGGQRMVASMMGGVIVLLVLVTSLGIVGLTSFSVTERTRQIGTRRALGARRVDVVRYFLTENWLLTSLGVVLGAALAVGLNIALVHAVEGTKLQAWILAGAIVLLWLAGFGAALAPALRAARIPPAIATRNV